ncbi:hypothetical protein [Enterovirga rhinocerotis]|uniref:Citrate lyase subunit beta/citryl-CoA lyase n=1 Tax=Enterovirga rhinocerotis TaxID=1339210 RepID=A0A4V3DYR8_9HYPH|nr:hypothetical protein [Enterovirga rhinocerotis]TDR93739.1 hypothetical protein EV668_1004 [Enterovirga rhinocerotis]
MLILLRTESTASALEAALAAAPDALVLDPASHHGADAADLVERRRGEPRGAASGHSDLLTRGRGSGPVLLVRVPPLSSSSMEDALASAMAFEPDGILLRGAIGRPDIERLGAKLAVLEAEHGRPAGSIGIVASVADEAAGALALAGLRPHPRLAGLVFDRAALAASLGCAPEAQALCHAAATTILAASACGVPAIALLESEGDLDGRDVTSPRSDGPQDGEGARLWPGLRVEDAAIAARREGFAGMILDEPRLAAALRPSSVGSSRTSSPASRRNNRGSRPA